MDLSTADRATVAPSAEPRREYVWPGPNQIRLSILKNVSRECAAPPSLATHIARRAEPWRFIRGF